MTFPTHILAGLIIGKLTGDYTAALTGSLLMDADHFFSYHRHGVLRNPARMLRESLNEPLEGERNIFHSMQAWLLVSLLVAIIDLRFGLIFSGAYLVHLILDAMTGSFYPFYPHKRFYIKKPLIRYLSKSEAVLGIGMLLVFIVI